MEDSTDLINQIEMLQSAKGDSTGAVSMYVRSGADVIKTIDTIKKELNDSSNIRSRQNRHNVQWALRSILSQLKGYRQLPENGLAIFVGKHMRVEDGQYL